MPAGSFRQMSMTVQFLFLKRSNAQSDVLRRMRGRLLLGFVEEMELGLTLDVNVICACLLSCFWPLLRKNKWKYFILTIRSVYDVMMWWDMGKEASGNLALPVKRGRLGCLSPSRKNLIETPPISVFYLSCCFGFSLGHKRFPLNTVV